jgi:hypothetical protein
MRARPFVGALNKDGDFLIAAMATIIAATAAIAEPTIRARTL